MQRVTALRGGAHFPRQVAVCPIFELRAKVLISPLRRTIRISTPRNASPLCPAMTPSRISKSRSIGSFLGFSVAVCRLAHRLRRTPDESCVVIDIAAQRDTQRIVGAALAFTLVLSPSDNAKTGKCAAARAPLSSSSICPRTVTPDPSTATSSKRVFLS